MEYQTVTGTDGQTYRVPLPAFDAIVKQAVETDPVKRDLLEALRAMLVTGEILQEKISYYHDASAGLTEAIGIARAAIGKAREGE